MSDVCRTSFGTWGPRELETMIGAYRAILQEICDTGALAHVAASALPARELRRIAAREVIVAAAIGLRTSQEIAAQAMARIAGKPAPAV